MDKPSVINRANDEMNKNVTFQNKSKCKHNSFWEEEKTSFKTTQEGRAREEKNGRYVIHLNFNVLLSCYFIHSMSLMMICICTVEVIEKPKTEPAKKAKEKDSIEKMDTA